MPEGPEHFKASVLINTSCCGKVFSGKVIKSAVSIKNPDVDIPFQKYRITSVSRGKELMLTLSEYVLDEKETHYSNKYSDNIKIESLSPIKTQDIKDSLLSEARDTKPLQNIAKNLKKETEEKQSDHVNIVFQFGMSGQFAFTTEDKILKHSHLMFYTDTEPKEVLSFVDMRRFARWRLDDQFSDSRGPDPMREYQVFRENILSNLGKSVFDKAICRVFHNQQYFNGIGNYLRAEILYRAKIPPFSIAREVLENLVTDEKSTNAIPDVLDCCKTVFSEAAMLGGAGYDKNSSKADYIVFQKWLQCYSQPGMKNLVDNDGRTIWFSDEAGKLAPKGTKAVSRHLKKKNETSVDASKTKKAKKEDIKKSRKKVKKEEQQPNAKVRVAKKVKEEPCTERRRSSRNKK